MGLDMYLRKYAKVSGASFPETVDRTEWTETKEVGYWRKANQIHRYFVDNIQNGIDDGGTYEIQKETIEDLCRKCQTVKDLLAHLEKKTVSEEIGWNGRERKPIFADNEVFVNTEQIANILPTRGGFFFGSTEYDSGYSEDIDGTIEICEKILKDFDFENNYLAYHASW